MTRKQLKIFFSHIFSNTKKIQPFIGAAYSPPVDAGGGRLFKVYVGKALAKLLRNVGHEELWKTCEMKASKRRIFTTQ